MPPEILPQTGKADHVLSQKSLSRNDDTFFWWKSSSPVIPSRLVVGLNQKKTPVTRGTICRWLHLVEPIAMSEHEIQPCTIVSFGILRYAPVRDDSAPVISLSDNSPLPPGDYGLFLTKPGNMCIPFQNPPGSGTFAELRARAERYPQTIYAGGFRMSDPFTLNAFPPTFEETVQSRDEKCIITGAEVDLEVCWIFPPAWAFMLDVWSHPETFDYTPFITVSNAGLMRKDLIPLFMDNAFGIDVDDNYRIIAFRDLGSINLPSHMPRPSPNTHAAPVLDKFLREHFRWTLYVHLPGSDISEDYTFNDILNYMDDLRLQDRDQIMVPFDDERWNTVLGKAIWENLMLTKVIQSRYENGPVSESEAEGQAETNSGCEIEQIARH